MCISVFLLEFFFYFSFLFTHFWLHMPSLWWFDLSRNGINEVALRLAGLVLRWVTVCGHLTTNAGQLSLAIHCWIGAMSNDHCC